jgi:hypothetical protein
MKPPMAMRGADRVLVMRLSFAAGITDMDAA